MSTQRKVLPKPAVEATGASALHCAFPRRSRHLRPSCLVCEPPIRCNITRLSPNIMLAKVYSAVLSQISPSYRRRRMDDALRSRFSTLTPVPFEGKVAAPRNCHVVDYYNDYVFWAAVTSFDLDGTANHPITNISFHKDYSKTSQHEYIVLQLSVPGDPSPYYLKLECTRDDGQHNDLSLAAATPTEPSSIPLDNSDIQTSPSTLSLATILSSFKKGNVKALDRYQYLLEEESKKNLLISFKPRNIITTVDVAVLAMVVHTAAPFYTLMRHQCFWFAYVNYEILVKVFGVTGTDANRVVIVEEGSPDNKEWERQQQEIHKKSVERGKWYVAINNSEDLIRNVDSLKVQFEAEVAKVKQKLRHETLIKIEEREEPWRKVERLEEESRKQKEESERQMDEVRRKIDEIQRQKEESDREVQRLMEVLRASPRSHT
ncbi:hypothetical protein BKA70DRAFT_1268022 [Coprinopsis sp. MPI-PUGE-AT-0042]|nr:hypothetical protein BKA70DRAFT_1268022 [Coprinopsis sp. MPI-PUGE-AT-0042]